MLVPIRSCRFDRVRNLFPCREASALECQRAQDFPPRLDQVQVCRILRLEHELPARMMKREHHHVRCTMHAQVVENGIDTFDLFRYPLVRPLKEVYPVDDSTTAVIARESFATRRVERTEDVSECSLICSSSDNLATTADAKQALRAVRGHWGIEKRFTLVLRCWVSRRCVSHAERTCGGELSRVTAHGTESLEARAELQVGN